MLLQRIATASHEMPEQLAVVAGGQSISYRQLARESDRIAVALNRSGIRRGHLVAIYAPRSELPVVSLVGVLKAGAAYTIVEDDGFPDENLARLEQIQPDACLTTGARRELLSAHGLLALDGDRLRASLYSHPLPDVDPQDIAYVLFTSGSTGRPKGVEVTHANIAHYLGAIEERLAISRPMAYAHVSTLAADLGNTSLFLALATGGCLHLIGTELRKDPMALQQYLADHGIEFLKITPSHWNAIFSAGHSGRGSLPTLEYLVFGGEAFPVGLAADLLNAGTIQRLFNHYGPTETTVGVTLCPVDSSAQLEALEHKSVPIGLPLGSTRLLVETDSGELGHRSCVGELLIGGPSVTRGYRNDPDKTEAAYLTLDGERYYRSGDLVEIDELGTVHFMGRKDRQVKINGYRVELEHIENVLRTIPDVEDAKVFYLDNNGRARIVAAILSGRHGEALGWLKRALEKMLPAYMIPKTFLYMIDFPRNANGKTDLKQLRREIEGRLAREAGAGTPGAASPVGEPMDLKQRVRAVCQAYLQDVEYGDDDNFFDAGGDSLDAIQIIAELQVQGFHVTAHAFLQCPTINGLYQAITKSSMAKTTPDDSAPGQAKVLSPAQHFFFQQQLKCPDHYNQALLLASAQPIDFEALCKAAEQLLQAHPCLRSRFEVCEGQIVASEREVDVERAISASLVHGGHEIATRNHIEMVAQHKHKSLNLADGELFRIHLFKSEQGEDQLLLVAHHVAVDVISWRILVNDLSRVYADCVAGTESRIPPNRTSFWHWTRHLEVHQDELERQASQWLARLDKAVAQRPRYFQDGNLEARAKTVWLGFTIEQTQALMVHAKEYGQPLHQGLLAMFGYSLAQALGQDQVIVDVESHGRQTQDDSLDISRVVGWHTSTFPFVLEDVSTPEAARRSVSDEQQRLPDLGIAFGLRSKRSDRPADALPSAAACFNYLGEVNFASDDRLELVPSRYPLGRARGDDNNRTHDLKLTAKVVDGHLVADLSFSPAHSLAKMSQLLTEVWRGLLSDANVATAAAPQFIVENGTRTGLINYVPRELIATAAAQTHREYRSILLTGATGYVGAYVLKELLEQSSAHVYCLVRSKHGIPAKARLQEILDWYFPDEDLQALGAGFTVIEGDIRKSGFGLAGADYLHLASECDAVYHFAADTRLFGSEEEFHDSNIKPVRTCIRFASDRRTKDLHYMSTLAVCGVNRAAEPVEFSEQSTDIGQEYQNFYEATKAAAERLVTQHQLTGHTTFIYRSGNVSGDSASARFQRNAGDNRFIQFLRAVCKLGQLPRQRGEPIALSPVDQVAAGLVALSLDKRNPGGVFHVDTPHTVSMERLFGCLADQGVSLQSTDHDTFADLFAPHDGNGDADIALGRFWAGRQPRNVRFNHQRTLRQLARLNLSFSPLDDEWLAAFVAGLIRWGQLPVTAAKPQFPQSGISNSKDKARQR